MKLKLMTFNIQHAKNFISKEIDYDKVALAIKNEDPDVVCLNEVYGENYNGEKESQAKIIADKIGYYYFFGKATTIKGVNYGNAILSKIPIEETSIIKIPNPFFKFGKSHYETRSIIKAKINGITVLVSHFGLNEGERKNAVKRVLKFISPERCILMGDFNMNSNHKLISTIKKSMIDTSTMLRSEKSTYPSDNPSNKIDYIFVSKDADIRESEVPEVIVSDHRPVVATVII